MGKGDKKTKRGKIAKGTFGSIRPKKKQRAATTEKKAKPKK